MLEERRRRGNGLKYNTFYATIRRKYKLSHTPIADLVSLFGSLPPPPPIVGGEDLYEMIMGSIEPDLLISHMPRVVLEMQNDTQEAKEERVMRYNRAFAEYDRRLTLHKQEWDKTYNAYRHASMESLTSFVNAADKSHMADIEQKLDFSLQNS